MTIPEVVKCPDGHFHQAVYGLGPYIADYPEQVWLSGIVQGWCPKYVTILLSVYSLRNHSISRCLAKPNFLDDASARRRTHEKTDFLINSFDPGILWDDFGIRSDVVVSIVVPAHSSLLIQTCGSHSRTDFHGLTFTSYCVPIYFIKSSRAHLRIIW